MWRRAIILLAIMAALQSCLPGSPGGASAPRTPSGLAGGPIEVTTLDGPDAVAADDAGTAPAPAIGTTPQVRPKPRPGSDAVSDEAAAQPEALAPDAAVEVPAAPEGKKSRDQLQCEKRGGRWSKFGDGDARTCVKTTRDAGKSCKKKTDCQSECLARSKTCAPYDPLLGCNEVLQSDGRAVTLCLD
jgi:hypothetical protein